MYNVIEMGTQKILPAKTFLVFMYGYPGSGKTAFARQLSDEIKAAHLQQDRLNIELYGENNDKLDKVSRNAMGFMTREFLRAGVSVIYDANVVRLAERRILRDAARQAKATPLMIWLQVDADTAYMRCQKRDRRKADDHYAKEYDEKSFENYLNKMQNPSNEDYIVLSGKHTYQTQRSPVYKKFYELGVLSPAQLSQGIAKPGLINLIPQSSLGSRDDLIKRRNISIR